MEAERMAGRQTHTERRQVFAKNLLQFHRNDRRFLQKQDGALTGSQAVSGVNAESAFLPF